MSNWKPINKWQPLLEPAINEEALFLSVRHTRMTVRAMELLVKDYCSRSFTNTRTVFYEASVDKPSCSIDYH